jgi:tripartite-type tricarboxylate transporter receptor subunit TctC
MALTRTALLLFTATVGSLAQATAQPYPARPVTLVVPYAAGGSADTLPRIVAERMRETLGKPIVIENVTGAAGSIGVGRVARAAPDGYTFGSGPVHARRQWRRLALPYDLLNDFAPISLIASSPLLIASKKALPRTTCESLSPG